MLAARRVLNSSEQFLSLHYVAVPAQPWPALEAQWTGRLTPERRAHVAALREPADRNASLLGLALLGAGCDRLGVPFLPGTLTRPPRGKPALAGGPAFSIAHAAGVAACVCASSGCVGLDFEPAGAVSAVALRLALGPAEYAQVRDGALDATCAWVMTEAVLKAAGHGIDAAPRVRLGAAGATLDGRAFTLRAADLGRDYVAYLAHDAAVSRLEIVRHGAAEFAPLP